MASVLLSPKDFFEAELATVLKSAISEDSNSKIYDEYGTYKQDAE